MSTPTEPTLREKALAFAIKSPKLSDDARAELIATARALNIDMTRLNAAMQAVESDLEARERGKREEQAAEDDKAYRRLKGAENAQRRISAERTADLPRSWAAVDHDTVMQAARNPSMTDVGFLAGELPLGLFYRGKVNGVHAESEAGKSWLCCLVAAQEVNAGKHVLYIDFEDDAASVYRRMLTLGTNEDTLRGYFHYVSPVGPLSETDREDFAPLVNLRGSLAVLDGVTESMALEGLDGRIEGDIATWHARVTKPLAVQGWAVVGVDHVPHGERRAIGSQHKRSAITGVSYLLQSAHPIAPGQRGVSRLHVAKDRGGWVRAHATPGKAPQWFADMVIDCRTPGVINAAVFHAAPSETGEGDVFDAPRKDVCTAVLAYVTAHPEATSKADIRDAVKGSAAMIGRCVDWLVSQNHLTSGRNGRHVRHAVGPKPYDQQE
jgi:hypothetical protein